MSKTIKFKAGKIQYDEESKKCTPIAGQGQVVIKPSPEEEGFYSFSWEPTSEESKHLEKDDLLIIPGDATFKHVKSCKDGRVVALTFLSSGAKNLYWLQNKPSVDGLDLLTDKDKEVLSSVQQLLVAEEADEPEPEERAEQKPAAQASSRASGLDHVPITSLSDVLTLDVISKHLASLPDEQVQEQYAHLLPDGVNATREEILSVIRTGFFESASRELSSSIGNNTVGQILAQNLGYEYQGEGLDAFLRGIRSLRK